MYASVETVIVVVQVYILVTTITHNLQVPKVTDPQSMWDKLKEFLERNKKE